MAEYMPTTSDARSGDAREEKAWESLRAEFGHWLAEVRREAAEKVWDEVADYHDRTNAPDIAESTRRDNPYRKEQPWPRSTCCSY